MIVITVARHPLSEGSVAANVLKHGTGGLNINGTRIASAMGDGPVIHTIVTGGRQGAMNYGGGDFPRIAKIHQSEGQELGRWPANLILSHLSGCRCKGTRRVRAICGGAGEASKKASGLFGVAHPSTGGKGDAEGLETVAAWECSPGCPVAALDIQTGTRRSSGLYPSESCGTGQGITYCSKKPQGQLYGDVGGASRFFKQVGDHGNKQVQETNMSQVPSDLVEYLRTMISPPGEAALYVSDLEVAWPDLQDVLKGGNLCGLIVRGTPSEEQAAFLMEALRPGAHLLLIAPDTEPTGHTGACRVEDVGFEIRDAILWVREPGKIHYVPKASRSEREEGCHNLPTRTGAEAVDREENTAGLDSPRAGAGRTASQVHNFHPTVKPKELMVRLLQDIPKDQGPVVDPFLGSGTTAMACLETGHDFIGIEREEDYLKIADARVRYHDYMYQGWIETPIESDLGEPVEEDLTEQSLDDFLSQTVEVPVTKTKRGRPKKAQSKEEVFEEVVEVVVGQQSLDDLFGWGEEGEDSIPENPDEVDPGPKAKCSNCGFVTWVSDNEKCPSCLHENVTWEEVKE